MKRRIFSWALVIIWMAVIFLFSHQPGSESSELSTGIVRRIINIVQTVFPNTELDQEILSLIIRKTAHFTIYMILGLLIINALCIYNISRTRAFILAILICILYAISDELHQLYIPGRSGQLTDVLIDSAGALCGILLMTAIRRNKDRYIYKENKI